MVCFKEGKPFSGSQFLQAVNDHVSAFCFSDAISCIEQVVRLQPAVPRSALDFVKKAVYGVLEILLVDDACFPKLVATFVNNHQNAVSCWDHDTSWWIAQFHKWLIVFYDFSAEYPLRKVHCKVFTGIQRRRTIIREVLRVLLSEPSWKRRWTWARWLLLLRLYPRLMNLKVALDARIAVLLLSGSIRAQCKLAVRGVLFGCTILLSRPDYPAVAEAKFGVIPGAHSNDDHSIFRHDAAHQWFLLHRYCTSLVTPLGDALDVRLTYCKPHGSAAGVAALLDTRRLVSPHGRPLSHSEGTVSHCFSEPNASLSVKDTARTLCQFLPGAYYGSPGRRFLPSGHPMHLETLGSHASSLSVKLVLHQFSVYHVASPRFLGTLESLSPWLSVLCVKLDQREPETVKELALQYRAGVDLPWKKLRLQTIREAVQCDRPRNRHGACLARCGCDSEHPAVGDARALRVLALGRNEVKKDPDAVHRVGSVRHAEIGCLLQVLRADGTFPNWSDLPSDEHRSPFEQRSRNHDASRPCMYIVELDDYDVGYWDAQACPLCTPALAKSGVRAQHFATPTGFVSRNVRYCKDIEAPTLDFALQRQPAKKCNTA